MTDKDNTENGAITEYDSQQLIPTEQMGTSVYLNASMFDQIQRAAKLFAASSFVPDAFKGRIDNCVIALDMAIKMRMHPMMLMQTMYIVHGKPGFEGKFVSALINNSGRYNDPLEYEWRSERGKPDWGCRAFAVRKTTGKTVYGPWVDWAMVVGEGWNKPKGTQKSKWESMPEIMFHYRAASFFGKINDADLLMNIQTIEELQDIEMHESSNGSYVAKRVSVAGGGSVDQSIYEPTAQAPEQKKQVEPINLNERREKPQDDKPTEFDEFGTPINSPWEKSKWFSKRRGDIDDPKSQGFFSYVDDNKDTIIDASEKAYEVMVEKYASFYDRPFPYFKSGAPIEGDFIHNQEAVQDTQEETDDIQAVLDSPAAKQLAEIAKKHPNEYLKVVEGKTPESIHQIITWMERINTLVVEAKINKTE